MLDQHIKFDFYSASSLKQQSADGQVDLFRHIILIPSQSVFALSLHCCMLSEEAINTNIIVFDLTDRGSNPRSTALDASTLTITPPMRFVWNRLVKIFKCIKTLKLIKHIKQIFILFSYIVEVSFIGGGNRSTQRKPLTSCKSLTNFII